MMKIRVASGKNKIFIPVPYFLMDNPLCSLIIRRTFQQNGYQIDPNTAVQLIKEFSKIAKQNRGLELVRVETPDGQFVQIVL